MNRTNFTHTVISLIFCALLSSAGTAQSQKTSVQQKIGNWQNSPGLANASIGIAVINNQTGEELIKSQTRQSLVPASILKVVTTATALEVFGPDFRFRTSLSYSGIIRNDTLFGNLQIIGGGDPTLGSSYFPENNHFLEKWMDAIKSKKIRTIIGSLILDASIYESQTIPNTWIWEDIGNYYGAGASGISVYDNLYKIHLSSENVAGKPTRITRITPEIPNLDIQNEVLSSDINSDLAYVYGSPFENHRIIRGTIPKGKTDFTIKASVPDPSALLANEFRKELSKNGISFSGKTRFEKVNTGKDQSVNLSVVQSPPLRDIIRLTNYESINLFAEHLLKHLAYQKTGFGTTKDGCKFVTQFWKDKGVDVTGLFLTDGCGLSRFNGITANQIVAILQYMKVKSVYSSDFYQSLATVGNGTLTSFSVNDFPGESLHAKSGFMTRVRCYAGYLTTLSGKNLSFVVMLNNYSCTTSEATKKIEELLVELRKM